MTDLHINIDSGIRFNDYADVIDVGLRFAFQPVVDSDGDSTLGQEALVRGLYGESAHEIIASIRPENLFYFDQACRIRAIEDAERAGLQGTLHLNCTEVDADTLELALASTAEAVANSRFEPSQIVLEFSSLARLGSPRQLAKVRDRANHYGFRILADNFGVGEAGLKRLAVLRPEFVKLDRELISSVHNSPRRQAMVFGIVATCKALGIVPIAAGVERAAEVEWLSNAGVKHFQGFYFAHPEFADRADQADQTDDHAGMPQQHWGCDELELSRCAA